MARTSGNQNTSGALSELAKYCSNFEHKIWVSGTQLLQVTNDGSSFDTKLVLTLSYTSAYYISGLQLEFDRAKCAIDFNYDGVASVEQLDGRSGTDVLQERIHADASTWSTSFRSNPGMIIAWNHNLNPKNLSRDRQDETAAVPPSVVPRVLCRVVFNCDELVSVAEAGQWLTRALAVSNQFLITPHREWYPSYPEPPVKTSTAIIALPLENPLTVPPIPVPPLIVRTGSSKYPLPP